MRLNAYNWRGGAISERAGLTSPETEEAVGVSEQVREVTAHLRDAARRTFGGIAQVAAVALSLCLSVIDLGIRLIFLLTIVVMLLR